MEDLAASRQLAHQLAQSTRTKELPAQDSQVSAPLPESSLRPRSDTSTSNPGRPRPKSQGSTTSSQSVEPGMAYPSQPSEMTVQQGAYVGPPQAQMYHQNPEELLLHYGQQLAHSQQHGDARVTGHLGARPLSQHGFQDMQPYAIPYGNSVLHYSMPQQHMHHMRHQSEQFEGSPAPEDSENPDTGGAKRRKGTASSMANDQELRRLLAQYQGKLLPEVAAEVQRNEGSGGKSEKAKQVFAMLWLQESCRRSNNSVRRDRVFSRYTERCGNERVPTLNPASFGKLVRIIFPNVQTRRLGVRGESKYHYVDLSLFPEDDDRQSWMPQPTLGVSGEAQFELERRDSSDTAAQIFQPHVRSVSMPQPTSRQQTVETADFPPPRAVFLPRSQSPVKTEAVSKSDAAPKMDCLYQNPPLIRIPITNMTPHLVSALPCIRSNLPATLPTYLAMPTLTSHILSPPSSQESPIDLPDIHTYLSSDFVPYDISIANSLSYLYRSYCIDVIDAFRKCKEKPFFQHHSAFNGKMTVPVAKLFALEKLKGWIEESDMRMYKQMIRYIAPLVMQVVPDPVWTVFDRVSQKLVPHLVGAFEEKCPLHVVVAKVVPAARFANLLKKLKGANASAMHVSGLLADDHCRTQMWVDLVAMVDPARVVDESVPPPEVIGVMESILRFDLKKLVDPSLGDDAIRTIEEDLSRPFASFIASSSDRWDNTEGIVPSSSFEIEHPGPLDRWIQFLERLPSTFEKHNPQCLINWHNGLWKSIMSQLGIGGAASYQAWWYLQAFLDNMLGWMTQMEGLLLEQGSQAQVDELEHLKKVADEGASDSLSRRGLKRKRNEDDVSGEDSHRTRSTGHDSDDGTVGSDDEDSSALPNISNQTSKRSKSNLGLDRTSEHRPAVNLQSDDLSELNNGGPLDLPSIGMTLRSSPMKRRQQQQEQQQAKHAPPSHHDDSGIDLNHDVEIDMAGADDSVKTDVEREREANAKFRQLKREWGILSDPADEVLA